MSEAGAEKKHPDQPVRSCDYARRGMRVAEPSAEQLRGEAVCRRPQPRIRHGTSVAHGILHVKAGTQAR